MRATAGFVHARASFDGEVGLFPPNKRQCSRDGADVSGDGSDDLSRRANAANDHDQSRAHQVLGRTPRNAKAAGQGNVTRESGDDCVDSETSDDSFADSNDDDDRSGEELSGVDHACNRLFQIEQALEYVTFEPADEHETLCAWLNDEVELRAKGLEEFFESRAPRSKILELLVVCKWRLRKYEDAARCFERYTRYVHAQNGEQPYAGGSLPSAPNERRRPRAENASVVAMKSLPNRFRRHCGHDPVAQVALCTMDQLEREWTTNRALDSVYPLQRPHSAHSRWVHVDERNKERSGEPALIPHLASTPEFATSLALLAFPRLTRKIPPTLLELHRGVFVNSPGTVRCYLMSFLGYEEKDPQLENIVIDSIFSAPLLFEVLMPPLIAAKAEAEAEEAVGAVAEVDAQHDSAVEENPLHAALMAEFASDFGPSPESRDTVCFAELAPGRQIGLRKCGEIVENSDSFHRVIAGNGDDGRESAVARYCDARCGSRVRFNAPSSLCVSTSSLPGNEQVIFVADTKNNCIRCVNPKSGATTTLELRMCKAPTKVATRYMQIGDSKSGHILAVVADSTTPARGQAAFFYELSGLDGRSSEPGLCNILLAW